MKSWIIASLLIAIVAVGIVVVACLLPTWSAVALLAFGVLVFLAVLARNPAHRYMRFAAFVAGAWLAAHAVPDLTVQFLWGRERFGEFLLQGSPGAWFDVSSVLLIAIALILDYSHDAGGGVLRELLSRVSLAWQRQAAGPAPANQAAIGNVSGSQNQININQHHGASAEEISRLLATAGDRAPDVNAVVDGARRLLDEAKPDAAEKVLTDLRLRYWDRLTPRERYRVLANLGRAKEALGRLPEAADLYFQAAGHQPDDNDAKALGAVAHFLLGRTEQAHRVAQNILPNRPASAIAAAVWIRSAPESTSWAEVLDAAPEEVRLAPEVSTAIALRALQLHLPDEAETYARRALDVTPRDLGVKEVLGTAIFQREASWIDLRNNPPSRPESPRLLEAKAFLSEALDAARSPEDVARARFIRAQVNDLLGTADDAETDFRVAREHAPSNQLIARQFAAFHLRRRRPDRAIDVLRDVVAIKVDAESSLFLASLLGDRGGPGDRREAADRLRLAIGRAGDSPPATRAEILGLLLAELAELQDAAGIVAVLADLPPGFSSPPAELSARADADRILGNAGSANEQAGQALRILGADSDAYERRMVADVLTSLGRFAEALTVWKGLVAPGELSPAAHLALDCAWEAEDYAFFLGHCEQARARGNWVVRWVERELNLFRRFHEHDRAAAVASEFLGRDPDLAIARALRLHLAIIGLEAGRPELVSGDPDDYPPAASARPEVGVAVSLVLKKGPDPEAAVRYAYELLRRNFSSPQAHYAFVLATGLGDDPHLPLEPLETVVPGAAVKYREIGAEEETWCIIEDGPSPEPDLARHEYAPDHPLARAMLGRRPGDSFPLREDRLQRREATITGIGSKYAYRKSDILQRWEVRFPERPFARMYRLERGPDGELDPGLIFRAVDQNAEEGRSTEALYRQFPISVLGFAQLADTTTLEALRHLVGRDDLPVRCCLGSQEELEVGLRAFGEASCVVIDPSSAATLFLTGFFRSLSMTKSPLITSEGTVREYRTLLEKSLGRHAFATRHRGRHLVIPNDPADRERARSAIEEFTAWLAARTRVEGGAELARLDRETRDHATREFGQPAAECLAIAIRQGAALWTDDFALAGYAAAQHGIRRTWTQAVAIQMRAEGRVEESPLDDLTIALVEGGFAYTRVPRDVILFAARRSAWDDRDGPFRAITRWIGSDQHTNPGAVEAVLGALPLIWGQAPLQQQKQTATLALLRSMSQRPGGARNAILLLTRLDAAFGLDAINAARCGRYVAEVLEGQGPDRLIVSA